MIATPAEAPAFDPYVSLRRRLLSPERVRELSRLRPGRAVGDALACWTLILASFAAVAIWPSGWAVALALPVIGTRYYGLFLIGHDGLHRRVFPKASHNDLFCDLLIFGPIGAITRLNNRNHIDHHLHLATAADPDRHRHGCFNKTRPVELIGFLTGATSVAHSIRNVFLKREPAEPQQRAVAPGGRRYTGRDLAILVGWQAALIGGLTACIGPWAWPVLWLLPVYVFTFLGDNARSFAEHSHPEPDEAADRHRLISFTSNAFERCLFAPMHMNFHAAHHLWPSIPYYNLPAAEREMRALPGSEEIEVRRSYVAYLWRYLRALPLEGCADTARRVEA